MVQTFGVFGTLNWFKNLLGFLQGYSSWFMRPPGHNSSSMFDLPLPAQRLVPFLRFRCGSHSLPSNIGRRRGVPRSQRLCSQCGCLFGDEFHRVFECPALADLRSQYQHLFASVDTMRRFLWQQDLVGVVHYVNSALSLLFQRL